jgi:hypothetical protein
VALYPHLDLSEIARTIAASDGFGPDGEWFRRSLPRLNRGLPQAQPSLRQLRRTVAVLILGIFPNEFRKKESGSCIRILRELSVAQIFMDES